MDTQGYGLVPALRPIGRSSCVLNKVRRVGRGCCVAILQPRFVSPSSWLDGSGQVYARFVYGTRVNVPEYMVVGSTTDRIVTDHLGSPRLVVDTSSGAVAQRVDYDEWGIVVADSNPGFQPFGFAGGLWDRDTGIVKFGYRDYDPSVGRWASKDPVRFWGGLNFYEYMDGDPLNGSDPSGLGAYAWLIRLLNNGERRLIRPLESEAEAVAARRAGENVVFETRQAARAVENAAGESCGDVIRHSGHELPNGEIGAPHFQTEGLPGHSFWGGVADILELFLPPIYLYIPRPEEA